ncbi:MAG: alpha/beta hydrolase [Candidatus Bathyarchaeota archaeon]|nr:alpha/beta hydrolase [Candidatus Bathyarchaeota archaeon]
MKLKAITGYTENGLPYFRLGCSPQVLVVFEGLGFENKPPSGLQLRWVAGDYKRMAEAFTVYSVGRKPNLPTGYSTRDMSDDYATFVRDELGGPVDVIGLSTGGVIAQYFALNYPDLVRHLVLASTGYTLSDNGRTLQRYVAEMARQGKWRKAFPAMLDGLYPQGGIKKRLFKLLMWFMANEPENPSDLLVTIEAEDKHNFAEHLANIKVNTLVIGGEDDFFYPIRETATGIPNAELVLYKNFGHNAWLDNRKQFQKDILAFLKRTL